MHKIEPHKMTDTIKSPAWLSYAAGGLIYVLVSYQTFILGALTGDLDLLVRFTNEGGVFEVVGALGFLIAAILFGTAFVRMWQASAHSPVRSRQRSFLG